MDNEKELEVQLNQVHEGLQKISNGMETINSNLAYINNTENLSRGLRLSTADCMRAYEVSMYLITKMERV